jgi:F-type H+-transporting ATPase subunit alpha
LRAFEDGFYPYLESSAPAILTDIATRKALDDDIKSRLTAAVKDFKATFLADLKDKKDAAAKQNAAPQSTPATAMVGNK